MIIMKVDAQSPRAYHPWMHAQNETPKFVWGYCFLCTRIESAPQVKDHSRTAPGLPPHFAPALGDAALLFARSNRVKSLQCRSILGNKLPQKSD